MEDETTTPIVSSAPFPSNPWGVMDFVVGIVFGSFGPLTELSRGADCFSAFYIWGKESVSFNSYFDRDF